MNMHAQIATLPNIDEIEAGFNKSMELFEAAFQAIANAEAAIQRAHAAVEHVTPGAKQHSESDGKEIEAFYKAVRLPTHEAYLGTARKLMTLRCWHYVIDRCGLRQLMDAQAKKEFDAQLRYVPERPRHGREVIDEEEVSKGPPPFTAENVRATMLRFAGEAGLIWRRGIANAFSGLDRRFRSHDGFKVGSRIILTRLANDWGSIDDYGSRAETFRDIERTFHILDGRDPKHAQSNFLHSIDNERRTMGKRCLSPMQSEHVHDFFKVRIFQNGNAHLWFTRDDLVKKVNLELAAYYGEVIGDGQTKEEDIFESRALTPARLYGFYPTPAELAEKVVAKIPYSEKPLRILEPSAGTGNLAFLAAIGREVTVRDEWDEKTRQRIRERKMVPNIVDAVEVQPALAKALRDSRKLNHVTVGDFLQMQPNSKQLYDGVIMNPPFDRERDIDHVTHALKFLKPDGWLLAIMSAGIEYRETRKSAAFRKLLDSRKGWMTDIPAGSFASVGTNVNTMLVGIGISRSWSV